MKHSERFQVRMARLLEREYRNGRHFQSLAGKRVALFAGAYNHISDGVTLTLNRLVRYLEKLGLHVLVFAPTSEDPPAIEHAGTLVSVPSIPFPGRGDYRLALGLPRKVRTRLTAFAPDIVHIATPDYLGMKALRWAQTQKIPVVSSFHTHFGAYMKHFVSYSRLYRPDLLENIIWRYVRWFYPQCEHIYVPTLSIAAELQSHGISKGLRLWPRGVDTTLYNPSMRSMQWRHSLGITDEEVIVSFVSRLVWEKGLGVFAEVIEGLEAQGVPHRSLIVGDGPAREALQERLRSTIFTGPMHGKNLATAYASSDIFLFPSDTETFGNVTLEAMASGLPAVCANATGSSSLVSDEETGFLIPPGDTEGFLGAVLRLISDHSLRSEFREHALSRVKIFSWEDAMEGIAGHYQDILTPSSMVDAMEGDGMASSELAVLTPATSV